MFGQPDSLRSKLNRKHLQDFVSRSNRQAKDHIVRRNVNKAGLGGNQGVVEACHSAGNLTDP